MPNEQITLYLIITLRLTIIILLFIKACDNLVYLTN